MPDLVFQQCRPSERATEIRALFQRAGKPEFEQVFERVYLPMESAGIRSWIGLQGGEAQHHISVTPLTFTDGQRTLHAGVLGDLMADPSQRDFWGPLKLVRQMVADVKRDGHFDFLMTSYLPAAEGVFKAGGLKRFADLRRNVVPLVRPYLLYRRLKSGIRAMKATGHPHDQAIVEPLLARLPSRGLFRPEPTAEFFRTRIPRHDYPTGTWVIVGEPDNPVGAVLACPIFTPRDRLIADVLWRDTADIPVILASAARWLAKDGYWRLRMRTLENSAWATIGDEAGFVIRPDSYGLMMLPLKPGLQIPPLEHWAMMGFALTGW